ncbi:DUF4142 domain-containing protein, partial [Streptomyces sp. NPDC005568]
MERIRAGCYSSPLLPVCAVPVCRWARKEHVVTRTRLTFPLVVAAAVCGIAAAPASAGAGSPQDDTFARAAHQGNLAEIAAGRDAQKHATTACVKTVGATLVRDHGKLDSDLRMLAHKLDITLPGMPTAEQRQELAAVQAKAGTQAYDTAWLKTQDAAHTATLAMIDSELKSGQNAEVQAAARAARPVVAMHLEMVRGGTCHAGKDAGMVKAGNGGQFAQAADDSRNSKTAVVLGDGLVAGAGAVWLMRG